MKVKEESEKAGLKLSIHKMKIMASGLITSRQIDGRGKVEAVTDLTFLGSKITVGGEIKRCLFLGRKATTNLDILKSRDNTLPTKVSIIKAPPPTTTTITTSGLLGSSDGKESIHKAENLSLIPGLVRTPREGNGNLLQYSCLENLMDRGAW